jgi:hypothetical protein
MPDRAELPRPKAGLQKCVAEPKATILVLAGHRVLKTEDGFLAITDTEVALAAAPHASPATRRLAELLAEFCSSALSRSAPRGA